jgi:hypothetical protein
MSELTIIRDPENPRLAHYDFQVGTFTLAPDLAEIGKRGWLVASPPTPVIVSGTVYLRYTLRM